jgi:hypothetical protein
MAQTATRAARMQRQAEQEHEDRPEGTAIPAAPGSAPVSTPPAPPPPTPGGPTGNPTQDPEPVKQPEQPPAGAPGPQEKSARIRDVEDMFKSFSGSILDQVKRSVSGSFSEALKEWNRKFDNFGADVHSRLDEMTEGVQNLRESVNNLRQSASLVPKLTKRADDQEETLRKLQEALNPDNFVKEVLPQLTKRVDAQEETVRKLQEALNPDNFVKEMMPFYSKLIDQTRGAMAEMIDERIARAKTIVVEEKPAPDKTIVIEEQQEQKPNKVVVIEEKVEAPLTRKEVVELFAELLDTREAKMKVKEAEEAAEAKKESKEKRGPVGDKIKKDPINSPPKGSTVGEKLEGKVRTVGEWLHPENNAFMRYMWNTCRSPFDVAAGFIGMCAMEPDIAERVAKYQAGPEETARANVYSQQFLRGVYAGLPVYMGLSAGYAAYKTGATIKAATMAGETVLYTAGIGLGTTIIAGISGWLIGSILVGVVRAIRTSNALATAEHAHNERLKEQEAREAMQEAMARAAKGSERTQRSST